MGAASSQATACGDDTRFPVNNDGCAPVVANATRMRGSLHPARRSSPAERRHHGIANLLHTRLAKNDFRTPP